MVRSLLLYPILCFHLLLFLFPFYCSSLKPLCNYDQSSALLDFKNSFILDNSTRYTYGKMAQIVPVPSYPKTASWENDTDCCLWDGVTCDSMSGNVIGLDLSCSQLYGNFHPNNTLFKLTHLQTLNLAFNDFNFSHVSPEFGGLVSLTHFNLSSSEFSGEIPSKISHLSKLVSLDLSGNDDVRLDQSIWKKFILNVTELRELVLDGVDMSLIRPNFLSLLSNLSSNLVSLGLEYTELQGNLSNNILCLPKLRELRLSRNGNLRVHLPNSNCSTSLRYLDLSETKFPKQLPDSFDHMKSLNHLILDYCEIQEPLPPSFWNLTQLTYLSLVGNNFNSQIQKSIGLLMHLKYLDLSYCEIQGPIPQTFWNLTQLTDLSLAGNNFNSEIPSSLSYFQQLTHLDLSDNKFVGHIPNFIGHLKHIKYLDLSFCQLQGPFPLTFWNLSQLTHLGLASNKLEGEISPLLLSLQNLTVLDLSYNKLTGRIPDAFSQNNITRFSNLISLDLSNNLLSGTIPSWCISSKSLFHAYLYNNLLTGYMNNVSSYSLLELDLSENRLKGNILMSLFDLVNLISFRLSANNLRGNVDFHQFSKLRNLELLDLSDNKLLSFGFYNSVDATIPNLYSLFLSSCNINYFPKSLTQLQTLRNLDLSNNNIHGSIPKWLNNVGNKSLSFLNLSHNYLSSVEHLSQMNLQFLDLSFNLLEGYIPIPPLDVEFFFLSNNKLNGPISSMICNASSLVVLNLSHNKLTGPIPQCLGTLSYLRVVDLQVNRLFGTLPRNFAKENELRTLKLNHNQLEGPLSRSLARCKYLEVLDLGHNQINDTFPSWLESLEELQVLVLQSNKFHGMITNFKTKHPFLMLRIFDVSNNYFSGPLPTIYMKNFRGMMNIDDAIDLQYMEDDLDLHMVDDQNYLLYYDSIFIIMKGVSEELTKILVTMTTIDFSNNNFEGKIPKAIGKLNSLKGLNLSHNRIIGTIPQSLGDLKSLEWLDLSSNKLVGEIPKSLTNLNYLSFLNLSQNQLVGVIPQGKQFNTFLNDSYEGNPGLCGFPLSKACDGGGGKQQPSSSMSHDEDEFGFGWKAVAVGYGCGFLFGVLMGYLAVTTGKPQWLVKIVEGGPKRRVRNTKRHSLNRGRTN